MASGKSVYPKPTPAGASKAPAGHSRASSGGRATPPSSKERARRVDTSGNRGRNEAPEPKGRPKVGIDSIADIFSEKESSVAQKEREEGEREEEESPSTFVPDNKHREPMTFSNEEVQKIQILFKQMSDFVKNLAQISSDKIASPILKEIANEGAVKRLKEYEGEIAKKIFETTLHEVQSDKQRITIEMLYENKRIREKIKEQIDEDDINIKNPKRRTTENILASLVEEPFSITKIKNSMFQEPTLLFPVLEIMKSAIQEENENAFVRIVKELEEYPFFSEDVLATF